MSALDDSNRAAYRRDLLTEVVFERFKAIPWAEVHRRPAPLAGVHQPIDDSPAAIAERVRILDEALTDDNGRIVPLAPRRAA